jgi:hypothetical protein
MIFPFSNLRTSLSFHIASCGVGGGGRVGGVTRVDVDWILAIVWASIFKYMLEIFIKKEEKKQLK